jgi:hypothetical protein
MADIINQQAIRFVRDYARATANLLAQLDRAREEFARQVVVFEGLTSGNVDADKVVDGGIENGKPPFTKLGVAQLKFAAEAVKTALDTNGVRQIIFGLADNTLPVI